MNRIVNLIILINYSKNNIALNNILSTSFTESKMYTFKLLLLMSGLRDYDPREIIPEFYVLLRVRKS